MAMLRAQSAPLTPDSARSLSCSSIAERITSRLRRRPVSPPPQCNDQGLSSTHSSIRSPASTRSGTRRHVTFSEALDVAFPPLPAAGQCVALWGYPEGDSRNGVTATVVRPGEKPTDIVIRADNTSKEQVVEMAHIRIIDQLCYVLVHTPKGQCRVSIRASSPIRQLLRTRALQSQAEGAMLFWNGQELDMKASPEQYDWSFGMSNPMVLHLSHDAA